jgi:hypothetical protein
MLAVRTGKGNRKEVPGDGVRGLKADMAEERVSRAGQMPTPLTGQGRDPAMFTDAL